MLKPGRETDARVAEVLGEDHWWFVCPKCGGSHFGASDILSGDMTYHCHDQFGQGCHWSGKMIDAPPPVSTSNSDAIAGLEAVRAQGAAWYLDTAGFDGEEYRCQIMEDDDNGRSVHAEAPTLPLAAAVAICKWGERQ